MALPDKATYSGLGGELDYPAPDDPTADIPDDASNETRVDAAAMTRMIGRAYCTWTTDGTTVTLVEHDAVWGNGLSVAPTITRSNVGVFVVTWPATVTDARGVTRALNLRRGLAGIEDGGSGYFASAIRVAPNTFTVVTQSITAAGQDETYGIAMNLLVW